MSLLPFLHVFAVGFAAALILLADKEAVAWFRGKKEVLDKDHVRQYHVFTWIALGALAATGTLLLYPTRLFLFSEPLFIAKLCFIAVLFVNAILIGRIQYVALTRPFASLSSKEKLPLFLSGIASTYCWIMAGVLGYIIANW